MDKKELKKLDVYDEKFLILFYDVVEKFVNEYDDMAEMGVIQKAQALLEELNNQ